MGEAADTWLARIDAVDRSAVDRDDVELLRGPVVEQRKIEVGDRRGIENAPELPLPRLHRDRRCRIVWIGYWNKVDRQVASGSARSQSVVHRVAVAVENQSRHRRIRRGLCIRIHQVLVANDDHPFRQTRDHRIASFQSFDNERTGCAAGHLLRAEAMNVRVIPIQARRLVLRNTKTVFENRVGGLYRRMQNVVFVAHRWKGEPVKMQIRRDSRHGAALTGIRRWLRLGRTHGTAARIQSGDRWQNGQVVLEAKDQFVARMDAQGRRFVFVREDIAIARGAVRPLLVVNRKIERQHSIFAAQVLRFLDDLARGRPRAPIDRAFRRSARRRAGSDQQPDQHAARPQKKTSDGVTAGT